MAVRWARFVAVGSAEQMAKARVIEPELDMSRPHLRTSSMAENLIRLIRWLTPQSGAMRAPMRSVARELEEAFPTSDA